MTNSFPNGNANRGSSSLPSRITEADVVSEVRSVIVLLHLNIQRLNTGAFRVGRRYIRSAAAGTLDFEGWDVHGRFVGIECKRPVHGRLSPAQKARIDAINAAGGVAGVVTSGRECYDFLVGHGCTSAAREKK